MRRGEEIFRHPGAIELREQRQALLVIAGVAAERGQPIGREGDEIGERETARDVLDIGVEATIFVDDEDRREPGRVRRPHQVALDAAIALRRRHRGGFGLDPLVVRRNLDRPGVIRPQHLEERGGGQPADGEFLRAMQKPAAADRAMHVAVEQVQQPLREIRCRLSANRRLLWHGCASLTCLLRSSIGEYRSPTPAVGVAS